MNHGETAPDLETFLEDAGEQSEKGFKYVASPYWHREEQVRRARARAAMAAVMKLIEQHISAFSPVVYSAVIQEGSGFRPPEGWYAFDLNFLAQASGMILLEIPGWKESRGVLIETAYAQGRGMPIEKVKWEEVRSCLDRETVELLERARNGEAIPQKSERDVVNHLPEGLRENTHQG